MPVVSLNTLLPFRSLNSFPLAKSAHQQFATILESPVMITYLIADTTSVEPDWLWLPVDVVLDMMNMGLLWLCVVLQRIQLLPFAQCPLANNIAISRGMVTIID